MQTRDDAMKLLLEYNKTDSLIKHALTVEAAMRYIAKQMGENEDFWGMVGLLHDLDYEKYPEEHCKKTEEILTAQGYQPELIRAIMCHGYGMCTDVEPVSKMENMLYTIDELCGLITASVYMRPSKSVMDIEVKSVTKKFKTASFAAGVNREVIKNGCDRLGMELNDVIALCIEGMRTEAEAIGMA